MNMFLPEKVGVIAHDLIGAVRGIERFTNYRLTPTVVLDGEIPENFNTISVTTMSKISSPRMAYLQTKKAISKCHDRYLYFYESLFLMGNISADIKAIIDELQPDKLIFCTAWPERNILIKGANSFIGNVPVSESLRARDTVTPIKESYIPVIVEKYTGLTPKLINIAEVERGPTYIAKLINGCPNRVIICDATKQYHLKNIAEAIVCNTNSWAACGSGGIIREITPLLGFKEQKQMMTPLSNKKPVLLVSGSVSDVTAVQLTTAAEKGIVYPVLVEPGDLWDRKKRSYKIDKLAGEAGKQISRGNNVAIASTTSRFIPQFRKITAYLLSAIAKKIIEEHNIPVLFASGADTAYALCRTMQIKKLEVKGCITEKFIPIIVKGYTSSGKIHWLCIKAGSTEDALGIVKCLQFIRQD
jgi:D-threonate/D-erythronate kinase